MGRKLNSQPRSDDQPPPRSRRSRHASRRIPIVARAGQEIQLQVPVGDEHRLRAPQRCSVPDRSSELVRRVRGRAQVQLDHGAVPAHDGARRPAPPDTQPLRTRHHVVHPEETHVRLARRGGARVGCHRRCGRLHEPAVLARYQLQHGDVGVPRRADGGISISGDRFRAKCSLVEVQRLLRRARPALTPHERLQLPHDAVAADGAARPAVAVPLRYWEC